jgi:hypothetical protein
MRMIVLFATLSSILVAAAAQAAWDGRPFSAQVVTSTAGGQDMTGMVYVDRPGMRMEQTSMGQQSVILVRFGPGSTTLLMPAEKSYMEMPRNAGAGAMAAQMEGPCGGYQRSTELGSETLQGRKVEKLRCEAPKFAYMPAATTIWYDPALEFVIRQESGPGERFELRNIEEGAQPAALFEIPAGYSKTAMPGMAPSTGSQGGTQGGSQGGQPGFQFDPSQLEGLSEEEKALIQKRMEEMMKQMEQPQ